MTECRGLVVASLRKSENVENEVQSFAIEGENGVGAPCPGGFRCETVAEDKAAREHLAHGERRAKRVAQLDVGGVFRVDHKVGDLMANPGA